MPPQRFMGGPNSISPYHQQFTAHTQHSSNHAPPLGGNAPSYLSANLGVNPFANGNLLGLTGVQSAAVHSSDTGLASQAARASFQLAGTQQQHSQHQQQHQQQLQQHAQQHQHGSTLLSDDSTRAQAKGRIRDVWRHNLVEEMAILRALVEKYQYIAMDTEFPGVVSRPMGAFRGKSDYHYQCLRTNVDLLNVIQIGIALFNEEGDTPPARPNSTDSTELTKGGRNGQGQRGLLPVAWQFNFKFSLKDDMFNQSSIESLQQAGLDFALMERDGINPHEFAALLIPSGLVCYDNVKWISFHGGYDFGYLIKLLYCRQLPCDETEFDQIMKLYFPAIYDVKHLLKYGIRMLNSGNMSFADPGVIEVLQKFEQKSGLETVAESLKVKRIGAAHQAGSDSLLTGRVFFQLRDKVYGGEIADEHIGKVWGLAVPDYSIGGNPLILGTGASGSASAATQVENTPPGFSGPNGISSGSSHGHQAHQSQNQQNGVPNTPNSSSVTLVNTPGPTAHNTNGINTANMGPMTPGGTFGAFTFGMGGSGR